VDQRVDALPWSAHNLLAGEHKTTLSRARGTHCHCFFPPPPVTLWRFFDYGQQLKMFKASPQPETMTSCPSDRNHNRDYSYLSRRLFYSVSQGMSSPRRPDTGGWAGELADSWRGRNDLEPRDRGLQMGCDCTGLRFMIGVPLGKVQMTAVHAANRLSHAFGALLRHHGSERRSLPPSANVPRFMMAVLSMEAILGHDIQQAADGCRKLQEILPQRPITHKGQNFVISGGSCFVGWPRT